MERQIRVLTDIKDLDELLNGARVDRTHVIANPGKPTQLIVELTRAMIERQTTVQQGFFKRIKTPFSSCRLVFSSIRRVTTESVEGAPPLTDGAVLSCEPVKGGYHLTIRGEGGTQIMLELDALTGVFQDIGVPVETP